MVGGSGGRLKCWLGIKANDEASHGHNKLKVVYKKRLLALVEFRCNPRSGKLNIEGVVCLISPTRLGSSRETWVTPFE